MSRSSPVSRRGMLLVRHPLFALTAVADTVTGALLVHGDYARILIVRGVSPLLLRRLQSGRLLQLCLPSAFAAAALLLAAHSATLLLIAILLLGVGGGAAAERN